MSLLSQDFVPYAKEKAFSYPGKLLVFHKGKRKIKSPTPPTFHLSLPVRPFPCLSGQAVSLVDWRGDTKISERSGIRRCSKNAGKKWQKKKKNLTKSCWYAIC